MAQDNAGADWERDASSIVRLLDVIARAIMTQTYTKEEVAKHTGADDCWIIVGDKVYDVSKFLNDHPGGKKILLNMGGKDATKQFNMFHNAKVLRDFGPELEIGVLSPSAKL